MHSDVTRTIQPRLAIGKRDDEHERAADLTANQVLGRPKIPSVPGESDQGNDFSGVIIHTGARAAESARSVNALSYTVGNHIVFGEGQYAPQFTSGRRLLAHELTHVLQQSQGGAANGMVMGTWDDAPGECSDIGNKTIDRVVVEQEIPQSVTLHWNDGSIESASCSTGKGHCCVDPANPDGGACTVTGSRVNGSNCTPITERQGYAIRNRYRTYNGWVFWNDFVTSRGIGLHQYPRLDGTPLSHGCVRLERDTARKIFCGARQNDTKVQVQGFARPMCNHANLFKRMVRRLQLRSNAYGRRERFSQCTAWYQEHAADPAHSSWTQQRQAAYGNDFRSARADTRRYDRPRAAFQTTGCQHYSTMR